MKTKRTRLELGLIGLLVGFPALTIAQTAGVSDWKYAVQTGAICQPATCIVRAAMTTALSGGFTAAVYAVSPGNFAGITGLGANGMGGDFESSANTAVRAETNASGEAALLADARATSGGTVGVHATMDGAGASLSIDGGGGPLLVARQGPSGSEVFRVAADGTVTVGGQPILEKGDKGNDGADGDDGDKGDKGAPGASVGVGMYPACSASAHCGTICKAGWHQSISADQNGCSISHQDMACQLNVAAGACCLCKR